MAALFGVNPAVSALAASSEAVFNPAVIPANVALLEVQTLVTISVHG